VAAVFILGGIMHTGVLETFGVGITPGTVEANIGHTPLLRLFNKELIDGIEIFAKAEHLNPGGSVKDRAALSMILEGERAGKLKPGMTIVDATSGNTGSLSAKERRRATKENFEKLRRRDHRNRSDAFD
jgi:threonine synthase